MLAIVKRKSTRMFLLFSSGGVVVYVTLLLDMKQTDITLGSLLLTLSVGIDRGYHLMNPGSLHQSGYGPLRKEETCQ